MVLAFRTTAGALVAASAWLALAAAPSQSIQVEAWRAKHEADYRREYVVLAGLFFLRPGANHAGSAASNTVRLPTSVAASIGIFHLDGDGRVRFEPTITAEVRLKGRRVTTPVALTS